jgi:gluconokinase
MIVVIMGVTGSGKTTIGMLLADRLGWMFADGDSFHPARNIEKMRRGIPLDDADRAPWLQAIHDAMVGWARDKRNVVIACSALKRAYRRELSEGLTLTFVYLRGSLELIRERLQHRTGHYADAHILAGQFADLEAPDDALVVDIGQSPENIVAEIRRRLALA